jgi:hypothetical protein
MKSSKALSILTLLASVAFASGSYWTPEFGGFDPARFPIPQVDPPLQPVGFAFSIWFVIYIWLIASGIYGVLKRPRSIDWNNFRVPLIVSLLVGAPWLLVAQSYPVISVVMIWVMWFTAVVALRRSPRADVAWARAPIGLYAGWLTAASCVGSSVVLAGFGLVSSMTGAIVMLLVGLTLAVAFISTARGSTQAYTGAVVWALGGIIINAGQDGQGLLLSLTIVGIILLLGAQWKYAPQRSQKLRSLLA